MSEFSLIAKFGMDATGLKTELKQLRKETNDFVNDWGKIGLAAGAAAFVALSKGAIDLAGHLTDTATNLGINVISLQALEAQHKRNGVSQEQLLKALEKTKDAVISAAEGDAKANAALAKLHLTAQQLIALPLDKQYEAIAKAAKNSTDQAVAYSAVSDLLGSKVAPKLMSSLKELATDGLGKVTKEAKAAGQVLSESTIAALDRAGDAIDDFKKKAVVAVGNIIVNFRTTEGLELMLFQLLKVAAGFGGGILDALNEANDFVKAVFTGAFRGVVNFFRDAMVDNITRLAELINKVLPEKFEINIKNIEDFKSSGRSIADEITEAIAMTKPSTFKKDMQEYWAGLIKDQQKIVDGLNNSEFKKEIKELKGAAQPIKTALVEGAAAVQKAISQATKDMLNALNHANDHNYLNNPDRVIQAGGKTYTPARDQSYFDDQSEDVLKEIIARNKRSIADLENQKLRGSVADASTGYLSQSQAQGWLQTEIIRAQAVLDQSSSLRGVTYQQGLTKYQGDLSGYDAAFSKANGTNTRLDDIAGSLSTIVSGFRQNKILPF